MYRAGKVQKDTIAYAYENRMTPKQLNQMNDLLSKRYDGKPGLYLGKSSELHASSGYVSGNRMGRRHSASEGLPEYLCQLEMEPRIDSDSLKREHDVAARIPDPKTAGRMGEGTRCLRMIAG